MKSVKICLVHNPPGALGRKAGVACTQRLGLAGPQTLLLLQCVLGTFLSATAAFHLCLCTVTRGDSHPQLGGFCSLSGQNEGSQLCSEALTVLLLNFKLLC